MKKIVIIMIVLTILALLICLSACGSFEAKTTAASPAGGRSETGILKTDYQDALPVISQMALGTFKLEESGSPLTSEQASQLATLWKGYRALISSSSTAPIELESLAGQIEKAYTEDQLKKIAELELTMEDTIQIAQEKNFSLQAAPGENREMTEEQRATRQALRQASGGGFSGASGGFPGGGMPGGGPPGRGMSGGGPPFDGMPEGGGMGPEAFSTPGAMETAAALGMPAPGGGGGMNRALIDALIEFLKSVAQ